MSDELPLVVRTALAQLRETAGRRPLSALCTVRRWTPTVFPQSKREANEAAWVKRELVGVQRCWLRALDASGVYLRAVAAGRPTRAPFSALMRASRTERAMESRLRTEWGL
jgi:hypothetical protein